MAKNHVVAAIDIGTAKICTLIAVVEEGGELRIVGASSVRSQGIRKSQIVNLEEATAVITESVDAAERMAGFSINEAYVSVSGRHIQSQNSKGVVAVADPQGDIIHEDIERVIEAARAISLPSNREILHVIPTSYQVDSQDGIKDPIGMSGVRLEAQTHIVTGSTTVLKNIRKCVEQLGIQVAGFVFAGVAATEAVISETEKELGVVLLDVGAGSTSVTTYVEGSLVYSGVIPVGALHITKDVALGSRISIPAAESVKQALAQLSATVPPRLPNESREEARQRQKREDLLDLRELGLDEEVKQLSRKTLIDGIIAPRLREILELAHEELKKHDVLGDVPAGIVFTGGGAETVGLLETSRKVFNLPARIGKPADLRGLIDEIETPMYSTVTGLLIYGKKQGVSEAGTGSAFSLGNFKNIQPSSLISNVKKFLQAIWP
jgi:cell division protein FtsA